MIQMMLTGTIGFVDISYRTGGNLELKFYDQGRALIATSGSVAVGPAGLNGVPMGISANLTQNGSNVDWYLSWNVDNLTAGVAATGTVASRTIGAPLGILISPYTQVGSSALGHALMANVGSNEYTSTLFTSINGAYAMNGYEFESSYERIARLCLESDSVKVTLFDDDVIGAVTILGVQQRKTFLDLLDDAATADLGVLQEARGIIGFVYRTGWSMANQAAVLTLDYSTGQVQPPFGQVDDDQLLLNDFTAKRVPDGSSYRAAQTTGLLAVTSPTVSTGVGRYKDSGDFNVQNDAQLTDIATWKVHVGTDATPRYPRVTVNLAKLAKANRQQYLDALAVNLDDRMEIINPKAVIINGTISQLVRGYTEEIASKQHEITFVCVPGVPYEIGELASTTGDTNQWVSRLDTDGATVNTLANAAATSLSVATPSGPLWTTVADDYPMYLDVGGVKVRATACSGASSPQTFTVDALPVARAAGLSVSVWHLPVLAQ
jgi:hypothetical protein